MAERNLDCLRDALIQETISRAIAGSSFYRSLYARSNLRSDAVVSTSDLARLPIVTKAELRAAGRSALAHADTTVVSHVQNTSGSTGQRFFLFRSLAEVQFISDFFGDLAKSAPPLSGPVPLLLQLQYPYHGTSTPVPGRAFVLTTAVHDPMLLDHAVEHLEREWTLPGVEPRVSLISGGASGVFELTNHVTRAGIDCRRDFAVRHIALEGDHITPRWRQVLESTWGATIHARYSMSEIFGGATHCAACGGYHFDPHVVPEIVDRETKERLPSGTGVLVLTSLFPFVQLQPMIRYWTGDLFRLDPDRCWSPSYDFLGRLDHSLFWPAGATVPLLAGVHVIEAVDDIPEASRGLSGHRDKGELAFAGSIPHCRGIVREDGRPAITIEVECAANLDLFPARRAELASSVRARLAGHSPLLASMLAERRIDLEIRFVTGSGRGRLGKSAVFWERC